MTRAELDWSETGKIDLNLTPDATVEGAVELCRAALLACGYSAELVAKLIPE